MLRPRSDAQNITEQYVETLKSSVCCLVSREATQKCLAFCASGTAELSTLSKAKLATFTQNLLYFVKKSAHGMQKTIFIFGIGIGLCENIQNSYQCLKSVQHNVPVIIIISVKNIGVLNSQLMVITPYKQSIICTLSYKSGI